MVRFWKTMFVTGFCAVKAADQRWLGAEIAHGDAIEEDVADRCGLFTGDLNGIPRGPPVPVTCSTRISREEDVLHRACADGLSFFAEVVHDECRPVWRMSIFSKWMSDCGERLACRPSRRPNFHSRSNCGNEYHAAGSPPARPWCRSCHRRCKRSICPPRHCSRKCRCHHCRATSAPAA